MMVGEPRKFMARSNSFARLLANTVFLLVLFPYITPFIKTPFDTQPYALLIAFLLFLGFLASGKVTAPRPWFIMILISVYAGIIYVLSPSLDGLRSLVGYISVPIFAFAALKTYRFIDYRIFGFAIIVWGIAAILEVLGAGSLVNFVLPDMRTGGIRGVTGLAPEPAHFARMAILFMILNEFFYSEGRYSRFVYIAFTSILLIQILLSLSGTGLLLAGVFFTAKGVYLIIKGGRNLRNLVATLVLITILVSIGNAFLKTPLRATRGGQLLSNFLENGIAVLQQDRSIKSRISDIILPFYSLFESKGTGFGLGTYDEYAIKIYRNAPKWVQDWTLPVRGYATIKSGFGRVVYELGLLGLLFISIMFYVMFRSIRYTMKFSDAAFVSSCILITILVIAVPLSLPLLGYLLGMHLEYGYRRIAYVPKGEMRYANLNRQHGI